MSGEPTPSEQALADPPAEKHHHVGADTVEAAVRRQLARALGGRRGMVEAAAPTITFTFTYVATKEIRLAIGFSVSIVLVALLARIVQRSTVQYVFNALVGIGVGCFFVWLGGRNGGDQSQQALAYFLPGLIYNAAYAVGMVLSILARWPVVGLLVGAVSDDPTEWRQDPQIVKLCSRLTWVLVVPCVLRVLVQLPIYLGGKAADNADGYVAALGLARVAMGWPLQLSALAVMVWLLARNRTPVSQDGTADGATAERG
ncbi:DUF3159 domain-containing protein [Nocardioides caldifontis]|uniref:DUF3159 domain-containing protein n=1 Tax=Nocardioides caldifontis TaxID=2588938 RepID=UPI0011E0545B|nr:DUF3159 domain-containing protein [Nocardioides caldifontis]